MIHRDEHKENYTVINNNYIRDKRLSCGAKGLMTEILSLPDDWKLSISALEKLSKDGKSAIRSRINELIECGYVKRTVVKNDEGKITEHIVDVMEKPQSDFPDVENPDVENPDVENQPHINTINTNTIYINTIYTNTKSNKRDNNTTNLITTKKDNVIYLKRENTKREKFEKLWNMYPNQKGKQKAYRAYNATTATDEAIARGIQAYTRYIQVNGIQGKYVKQGGTWFNNECWNDDYRTEFDMIKEWADE